MFQAIQPLDIPQSANVFEHTRMPRIEHLGTFRFAVPFLGKVLTLGGLVPYEPLRPAVDDTSLDEIRHAPDHIDQQIQFAVVGVGSDAIFIALGSQGRDKDGNGRLRRIEVVCQNEDVDVF